MVQGSKNPQRDALVRRAPRVSYRLGDAAAALKEAGTLAVLGFGSGSAKIDDPRALSVALESFDAHWSAGAGWLFAAIELDERDHAGPEGAARVAYAQLRQFLQQRVERHVLRLWNYLGAINQGDGDAERYKHFCDGRASGMGDFFADGFPAASAIGHHEPAHRLQVYLLACDQPGERVENPRQVSAWRYPRQYGRTPPSFARAMSLPAGDVLAISGTAAVVGHASAHDDDLDAQLDETLINLEALLASADMPAGFDTHSPLKAYVRHAVDAPRVRDFFRRRLPGVPVLLLHGDICRRELLVEIDGWRYA
jgi:chorismate lyase/3-hydroxybenzoate synthase